MKGKDVVGLILLVLGFISLALGIYAYIYVVPVTLYGFPIENLYPYRERAWAPILAGVILILVGLFICGVEIKVKQ